MSGFLKRPARNMPDACAIEPVRFYHVEFERHRDLQRRLAPGPPMFATIIEPGRAEPAQNRCLDAFRIALHFRRLKMIAILFAEPAPPTPAP